MVPAISFAGLIPERSFVPVGLLATVNPGVTVVQRVGRRPLPRSKYVCTLVDQRDDDSLLFSPTYSPASLDMTSYLRWFEKLSRNTGVTMETRRYVRASEILECEFGPFVHGGLSNLLDVIGEVDMSKSPGYPYVYLGCDSKQQAWLEFHDSIIRDASSLICGRYIDCTFLATLKDELVLGGKKARVFCPSPFHHQVACGILFKRACDDLIASVGKHSSALGINIVGQGLNNAFRRLSRLPRGYDCDHTGYDTSFRGAEPERDFLKRGIPQEYHRGVDLLFDTALCPRVLLDGNIFICAIQPSGWYLTAALNTLKNYRQVCEAFLDIHEKIFGFDCGIDYMRQHLCVFVGGDDNAFSTDEEWFNIVSFAEWGVHHGAFLEADFLYARDPMDLTFYSHKLYTRWCSITRSEILVAGGRLSKIISAFNYRKKEGGKINYLTNAQRINGLLMNLWPYEAYYNAIFPYAYHLIHQLFLESGAKATGAWTDVFRSIPSDMKMYELWLGRVPEGFPFFPPGDKANH